MYLYDFYTNALIKQWKYLETKSSNYNLNIGGIKSGMYVLKMERNNKSTTTKIIIQ
jgi:transcription initiation factor TFIID subunit TAF12